ncbi:hypothetical protein ACM1RC_27470 [Paenibacillus azoreducens]|uniref:hypothetical protein n=1 Tax=Paenibacillus azoreducens TaxID=116718 RepID=UPI0039F63B62
MNFEWIEPAPTMNIYAKNGDKVRFLNRNGHDREPAEACDIGLVQDGVYTVERTEVGGWLTDVFLKEFPGRAFNSVMFEDYKDES